MLLLQKQRLVLLLMLILSHVTWAQTQTGVALQIAKLANSPSLESGQLGVCIVDVATGAVLAAQQPDKSLMPASTFKAITTATAMQVLGAEYQFSTTLAYTGSIDASGVLQGDLYVVGGGDPTLGSDACQGSLAMDELLLIFEKAILNKGIRRIQGRIIGDASAYSSQVCSRDWEWADLGNYYACGAWGLNFHENLYFLHFDQPSRSGRRTRVHSIVPEVPDLTLINEVTSAGINSGDQAYIFGAPYSPIRYVRGTIPAGNSLFTIKGSLPNPPLFAAYHLHRTLENCGIDISQEPTTFEQTDRKQQLIPFFTYQSPILSNIAKRANFKSVNLYCEVMLREMGRNQLNNGSDKAGIQLMKTHWSDKGVNLQSGFYPKDGSGLSRSSVVTTRQMAEILRRSATHQNSFADFRSTLPRAGMEGTLKYFLRGTAAAGNVWGKSGSIERVRGYTGYIRTRSGRWLAFAIIANNFSGSSSAIKSGIERIVLAAYEER